MPRIVSPRGHAIVAILETVPCTVGITDVVRGADGKIVFEYDGSGNDMDWDSQEPDTSSGQRRFLCEDGDIWRESDLVAGKDE